MVDAVIAIVVLEGGVFLALGRRTLLPNLAAGLLLLIAMRLALGGAALPWVGLTLLTAGLAHALDLKRTLPLSLAGGGRGEGGRSSNRPPTP